MSTPARRYRRVTTNLGDAVLTADSDALIGLHFDGQAHMPKHGFFGEQAASDDDVLGQAAQELVEYFRGERRRFTVRVRPIGTEFQRRVWHHLTNIPFGTTVTYGDIAKALVSPDQSLNGLAQGVGQAVGHNPVTVIIPCHRVLGSDGSLTGFAGGLDRKRWLLAHEESDETRESRLF